MFYLVAYQGIEGSNSESAALAFSKSHVGSAADYLPCVTARGVAEALINRRADLGVVAVSNSTTGIVDETETVLSTGNFVIQARIRLPITHCLYVRSTETESAIKSIVSHEQAIRQCADTIKKRYPAANIVYAADTSLAARDLAEGAYLPGTGVVCSRKAGELAGLSLVAEKIQDLPNNETEFALIQHIRKPQKISFLSNISQCILHYVLGPSAISLGFRWAMIGIIVVSFFLSSYLSWSPVRSAIAMGVPISVLVSFLFSRTLQRWVIHRKVLGYWEYSVRPESRTVLAEHNPGFRRFAVIDTENGELRMRGFKCDPVRWEMWRSRLAVIAGEGDLHGQLAYWYENVGNTSSTGQFHGFGNIEWSLEKPWLVAEQLSGWYFGRITGEIGRVVFDRVPESLFKEQVPLSIHLHAFEQSTPIYDHTAPISATSIQVKSQSNANKRSTRKLRRNRSRRRNSKKRR